MKKYLKGLVLSLVAVMAFIPFVGVKAEEVKELNQDAFDQALAGTPTNGVTYDVTDGTYKLAAGSYKITGDITIDKTVGVVGNVTLDTNGKDLTITVYPAIGISGSNSLTINGTGTISGNILVCEEASLTINDGNFVSDMGGAINAHDGSHLTINNGKFTAGASAVYVMHDATATITGGEFTSLGDNGVEAGSGVLNISGGTFKGFVTGLMVGDATLNLSGGKFIATDDLGGITISDANTTVDTFNSLLLEGYEYSPSVSISKEGNFVFTQKEIEVKKIAAEETEEPKTNNPNTSDNIMIYISLLGLSLIGLVGTKLSKKGLI